MIDLTKLSRDEIGKLIAEATERYDELTKQERKFLPEDVRDKLKSRLADSASDSTFGDGLERQYLYEGAVFQGYDNMSDADLVDEYCMYMDEEDEDEFRDELRTYQVIEEILT